MKEERLEQRLREHFMSEVRGTTPPPEWWDRKISQLDEEKKPSGWHILVPKTRLAWVILPIVLLLLSGTAYAAGSLIHNNFFGQSANHTKPGVYYVPTGVIYFQEIPDIIAEYGGSVELDIVYTNYDSMARILMDFPSEITIESRDRPFDDRIVRTFDAGEEQIQLEPGESKQYRLVWDQTDDAGQQLPYGWYEIRSMVRSRQTDDTKSSGQGSGGRITLALILPPEGTMVKEITIDRTLTDHGATVELKNLEIKKEGADLHSFIVPPDYAGGGIEHPFYSMSAEYRIDDGEWKLARPSLFGTALYDDGISRVWALNPIPLGSRELTFRITEVEGTEGPWEFKITLQQPGESTE